MEILRETCFCSLASVITNRGLQLQQRSSCHSNWERTARLLRQTFKWQMIYWTSVFFSESLLFKLIKWQIRFEKETKNVILIHARCYCWKDKLELWAEVQRQRGWIRGRDAVWESTMNLTVNRSLFQPLTPHLPELLQPHHRLEEGACMHGKDLSLSGDSLREMAQVKTWQSAAC